ncbi:hypothetical protein [Marinicella sp. W31]|uniref:DUF6197 family protein n=1 Tax=Marinicella sp. W31 TaxID=3023713 RepID=UPI003757F138
MHKKAFAPLLIYVTLIVVLMLCSTVSMARKELWFGSYVDNGQLFQGRYNVTFDGETDRVVSLQLAPYGKPAIDFKIIDHDMKSGFITAEWPGTDKKCNFFRYSPDYYSGNWISGTSVEPMVLKRFNGQDAERQGNWFKASATEIKIIKQAKARLKDENTWNRNDDRICSSKTNYSLFCALYASSVEIDGEYRHLRPAIKAVREAIEQKYPKRYDHVLVDFNNSKNTSLANVFEIFDMAEEKLMQQLQEQNKTN